MSSIPSPVAAPVPTLDASPLRSGDADPVGAAAGTKRLVGFDVVRALAAASVIWVHAGRSPVWQEHFLLAAGSWGTAFLNTLAGYFVVHTLKNYGAGAAPRFALHRFVRLYGAFLIWSLVYVAARLVNYAVFHKESSLELRWDLLFFGTTYHLWFLPYLVVVTLVTLPLVALATRSRERMTWAAALFGVAAMLLLIVPEPAWVNINDVRLLPWSNIYQRSPGFLAGLAIGLWVRAGFRPRVTALQALACVGVVVCAMYLSLTTELPRHILNRIAATAAFVIALAPWHGPLAIALGRLGQLGFGVYLCHVLFTEGFIALAGRLHLTPSLGLDLTTFAASVVCSFGLAWALRRLRWLGWLIP